MKINEKRFVFTREELTALIAHAGDDEKPELAYVVLDAVDRRAYASTRHRAAMVHAEAPEPGEEASDQPGSNNVVGLSRASLEKALRVSIPKGAAIHVTLAGELRIVDRFGADVLRATVATTPLDDAAPLRRIDRAYPFFGLNPPSLPRTCPVFNINLRLMGAFSLIGKAAGNRRIDIFPGETNLDPILFRVGSWQVVLMPCKPEKRSRMKKAA